MVLEDGNLVLYEHGRETHGHVVGDIPLNITHFIKEILSIACFYVSNFSRKTFEKSSHFKLVK
jgi:hypothetical protein